MILVPALAATAALLSAPPHISGRIAPKHERTRPTKNPRDGPTDSLRVAADIQLFAATLRAGRAVATAVDVVANSHTATDSPTFLASAWRTAASLYALGASPDTAWQELETIEGLSEVASLVKLSETSGSSLASGCERVAEALLGNAADHATARAERAGVLISIPLALCFLPAFFVLGLAPVVISLGTELIPTM